VNLATGYEYRFGAALAASVVVHAGALMLTLPAQRAPSLDAPLPLSVRLVQETAAPVAELARPARPAATRPARARPARPRHKEVHQAPTTAAQALPPVEAIQAAPPIDEAPAIAPEPAAPQVAASAQSAPEVVSFLAPVPPPAPSAALLLDYTRSLSKVLDRYKEYPRIAELRGWEGSVTMRLRVAPSGRLLEAAVYQSSGYEALDKQAITMVSKAGALPVPPRGLDLAEFPVLVPINFRLER
jgi:periplasmic protein TonB